METNLSSWNTHDWFTRSSAELSRFGRRGGWRRGKSLRNRLEKCHFQALGVPEIRNRPVPALLKRPSAKTDPGTLQREVVQRM
jgi:hypothetical protein